MHSALIVLIAAYVTIMLRLLPFIAFRGKETPEFINYLGRVLPHAIMAMLVVFCLKDVSLRTSPHGLPELIACAVTAGSYVWRRNTLLSIGAGTLCYMLLVQMVF